MFVEHKEVGEIAEAPAKTLKLSEAIRIGARIRPQGFFALFEEGRSCALGAAYEAVTAATCDPHDYIAVDQAFGRLLYGTWLGRVTLLDTVASMNDRERLTREQIADWLEARGY